MVDGLVVVEVVVVVFVVVVNGAEVVVVVVAGTQLSVTFVAPAGTPGICDGGVLADAFTVIVTDAPPCGGV